MAKLSSSINLIDNISKVLNRITGNADKMQKSINNAQNQMNQQTNFAKNMSIEEQVLENVGARYNHQARLVSQLREKYEESINTLGRYHSATQKIEGQLLSAQDKEIRLASAVEKAGREFDKQDDAIKRNISSSDRFINKLKKMAGAYLGLKTGKKLMQSTIMQAGELTKRVGIMQAAFGNADVGKNYFNQLQLYAIATRQDIDALTEVTRNFMQITKNTKHLKGFTDAANKLSLRTGNIGSAENLLQEAMRGNFSRLQRALHLTDKQIEPLKRSIAKGSLEGIIKGFDDAMNTAGLTDAVVDAYQNSPIQKMDKIMDKFKTGLAMAGQEALSRLEPVMDRLNNWLDSSNADRFFGAIALGISMVVQGVSWLTGVIVSNWDLILPILIAVSTVYLTKLIMQLWATIPPLLMQLSIWIGLNYPILMVIGTIALFIGIMIQSGITAEQVLGTIGAMFGLLYATIYNIIIHIVNAIGSMAEFFVNVWNYPMYTVKSYFVDLANSALNMGIAMTDGFDSAATNLANAFIKGANIAISAVNGIINVLNKIPGVDIGTFGKISATTSITRSMKNTKSKLNNWLGDKPSGYWEAPKFGLKSFGGEMAKGYEYGASIPGKFSTGLNGIKDSINGFADQENAWNNLQGDKLGNLNDVGKKLDKNGKDLKKSVDRSQEDLKWIRDLAEQETINRFTTAEVKVEVNNNNNINSDMDLDGVIDYMVEGTEEALQRVAEGV